MAPHVHRFRLVPRGADGNSVTPGISRPRISHVTVSPPGTSIKWRQSV